MKHLCRKCFSLRALGPERHEKSNHGTNFRSKMFIGSFSHFREKWESHHAKIVNYNAFSEFLQMVPKHNIIGPFKLFLFIGQPFLVWIFGDYLNHTFFESIIFPASRKHARRCYLSRKSVKSCLGVTPVT